MRYERYLKELAAPQSLLRVEIPANLYWLYHL